MANGGKRVVFNTRERVISNDHNRLQDMIGQARAAQLARASTDVYFSSRPGHTSPVITGGQVPMVADVFGGLFVKVDDPTSLFVDAGVLGVVDPDATPGLDDDPYKLVNDPGLQTGGVLTFLANASGSRRIDVVLADVVDLVLETDNRDIFDPATGLFTPQTVNKVVSKRLSYTIIRGTPGLGMPALTNTLPLVVASVPDGALTWADATFWDVRPLWQDRSTQNSQGVTRHDNRTPYDFNFSVVASEATGEAWSAFGGYLAGGKLMKSTPTGAMGTGDVKFDFADPENATNNLGILGPISGGSDPGAIPLFALFPNGLPRWSRYSEGAAPSLSIRAPYGPRGILVAGRNTLSDKTKVDTRGLAANVSLPASTGLTGTANGVMLFMGHVIQNAGGGASMVPCAGCGREVLYPAGYTFSPGQQRLLTFQLAVAQTQFMTWDLAILRDSNDFVLPKNMVGIAFQWTPPSVETFVAAPPPSATYDNLGFFSRHETLLHLDLYPQQSVIGDGTVVPERLVTHTSWMPLVFDPDAPAANLLRTGIASLTASSGSSAPLGGQWQFSAVTSNLELLGYRL
jgi:hypothetical protein